MAGVPHAGLFMLWKIVHLDWDQGGDARFIGSMIGPFKNFKNFFLALYTLAERWQYMVALVTDAQNCNRSTASLTR